jgi:putative addiction module CopG family antidote
MQTMNISLPEPMKQFVEDQVEAGDYSSASERDHSRSARVLGA